MYVLTNGYHIEEYEKKEASSRKCYRQSYSAYQYLFSTIQNHRQLKIPKSTLIKMVVERKRQDAENKATPGNAQNARNDYEILIDDIMHEMKDHIEQQKEERNEQNEQNAALTKSDNDIRAMEIRRKSNEVNELNFVDIT